MRKFNFRLNTIGLTAVVMVMRSGSSEIKFPLSVAYTSAFTARAALWRMKMSHSERITLSVGRETVCCSFMLSW